MEAPLSTIEQAPPENNEEENGRETELAKYWKAVEDNPMDFTGWTYLLQYVEQEVCANCRFSFNQSFLKYAIHEYILTFLYSLIFIAFNFVSLFYRNKPSINFI